MPNKITIKNLLTTPLDKSEKIAFICSPRLGDTLIGFVIVNNLLRNGYRIDVFGDYANYLSDWFPSFKIFPAVKPPNVLSLSEYKTVLHMYPSELSEKMASIHPRSIVLVDCGLYHSRITMVDIMVEVCQKILFLHNLTRTNGIQPPTGLTSKRYPRRIVIHPTSALPRKNWPLAKFIKLAKLLSQQGYEPVFITAANEEEYAKEIIRCGFAAPKFSSLSEVAAFLYESGYFIGNDSGIGHLASNLGVPTVTIVLRKGVARQWRPSWAPNVVVLSPNWLNPRPIKEKLWKYFTSVNRVKAGFNTLLEQQKN